MTRQLTAIIKKEGSGYVALCPEVDIASQGDTVGEARKNLKEALDLFFETASPEEIATSGKLDALAEKALAAHKLGKSKAL